MSLRPNPKWFNHHHCQPLPYLHSTCHILYCCIYIPSWLWYLLLQNRGVLIRQGNRQLKEVLLKYASTVTNFPLAPLLIFNQMLCVGVFWILGLFQYEWVYCISDSYQQFLLVRGRVKGKKGREACHAESEVTEHPSVPSLCALIYSSQSTAMWFAYPTYNYYYPLFEFFFFSCPFVSDIALIILAVLNVRNHCVINQPLTFKHLLVIYRHINVITDYRINESFDVWSHRKSLPRFKTGDMIFP